MTEESTHTTQIMQKTHTRDDGGAERTLDDGTQGEGTEPEGMQGDGTEPEGMQGDRAPDDGTTDGGTKPEGMQGDGAPDDGTTDDGPEPERAGISRPEPGQAGISGAPFYRIIYRGDGLADVWLTPGKAVPAYDNLTGRIDFGFRLLAVTGILPWDGMEEDIRRRYTAWIAGAEVIEV